jgi:hypothetical protein
MSNPKIILWDIESFPIVSYNWGTYQQDALKVVKDWELASFAYKELGSKKTHVLSRRSFKDQTDKSLVRELYKVLDSADILVGHNGDRFDLKKAKAKFILHGLPPLSKKKTVDTLKIAKKQFAFTSNRLDSLGEALGVGRKVKTGGFDLWLGCMANDTKSWKLMEKYNRQDVELLERVYLKLRPWGPEQHPHVGTIAGKPDGCPVCGDERLRSCGIIRTKTSTFNKYRCAGCLAYCRGTKRLKVRTHEHVA